MATVDATFSEKWKKEAHIEYKKQESVLKGKTLEVRQTGRKYHFPVFYNEDIIDEKARHADVTVTAQVADDITVTAKPFYIAYQVDDWDQALSDVNYRNVLTRKAVGAIWRGFDSKIITALNASGNAEIELPTANTYKFDGSIKMAASLNKNDVPKKDRFALINSGASVDLLNDPNFTNNYHFKNNAVRDGVFENVAGFMAIEDNYLLNGAAGATERRCPHWHKEAVGTFIAQDFRLTVDWDWRSQGYWIVASMVMGSVIIDPKGVQFCDVTED